MMNQQPYEPYESEAEPKRGEGTRILMYILLSVALYLAFNLLSSVLVYNIDALTDALDWGLGTTFSAINLVALYGKQLVSTILCRRLVFRSRFPLIPAVAALMVLAAVWQTVSGVATNVLFFQLSMELYEAVVIGMNLVWLAVNYLFQRFVLYRNQLDNR